MKKTICTAAAVLFAVTSAAMPVSAIEAGTYQQRREIIQELGVTVFPDPNAGYLTVTEGDFEFRLYDGFAVLSDCKNTEIESAVIPGTVEDLPVVGIVDDPFRFCRKLTSITLPDSFTHFQWDHLINTFSVRSDSDENPMPSVKEVLVSETNPNFTVQDGMLYSKDMKMLIGCPPASEQTELHIAEETDSIGEYAFFACIALEKAIVPDQIQHIHCNAFTACFNLTYAELPESITVVSGDMFYYCQKLEQVVFRGDIQTIGYGAFNQCTALTSLEIPETVTQIGWHAFDGTGCCENEDGLLYVQNWLVGSENSASEIRLRAGTDSIAEMAVFSGHTISYIEVPASIKNYGFLSFSTVSVSVRAEVHYDAAEMPERFISNVKNAEDIYIYDPDCVIFDSAKTIPATFEYTPQDTVELTPIDAGSFFDAPTCKGDAVIHGYANSTAQAYAEKYERKFVEIEPSGDLNCDGFVNTKDAVLLQKYLLGASESLARWKAADLNSDGRLHAVDLTLQLQMILNA